MEKVGLKTIPLLLSVLLLFGCQDSRKKPFKVVKVLEIGATKIADSVLMNVLEEEKGIQMQLEFSTSEDATLDRLTKGEIDFAIIPNNTEISMSGRHIRTVVPLLPRVLLVLIREDLEIDKNLDRLLYGKNVGLEIVDQTDSVFFNRLAVHYNIDTDSLGSLWPVNASDINSGRKIQEVFKDIDVYITLTHLRNPLIDSLLNYGARIFSLDQPNLYDRGSSVEGFTIDYPQAYPFLLPKSVYAGKPDHPVFTLAVRDILICSEFMDEGVVYNIAEVVREKRSLLTMRDRNYGLLPRNIQLNESNVIFPYHSGTISYINRDKPSFFERYAELFGVIFSISLVLYGGLASIRGRYRRVMKDRVDVYYKQLLILRNELHSESPNFQELENKIEDIRTKAFNALIDERLNADESFKIFLDLYAQVKGDMREILGNQKRSN